MTDTPTIDFLILADRAEVVGGRLFLMGGAWDTLAVADFSAPVVLGMAVGILMPVRLAGTAQPLKVRLERQGGAPVAGEVEGSITVAPGALAGGRPLHTTVAGAWAWTLPGPGTYRVVASVGGGLPAAALFTATTPQGSTRWQA